MKITLETFAGTYTAEPVDCKETIDFMFEQFFAVLLAAGFNQEQIDRYIGDE